MTEKRYVVEKVETRGENKLNIKHVIYDAKEDRWISIEEGLCILLNKNKN